MALESIKAIQPVPVVNIPCYSDLDYAYHLDSWWGKANLCIIEHDIVPTVNSIYHLVTCNHDVCVYAYYLYPRSTGLTEKVIAHRVGNKWIEYGVEWCTQPSLGFIHIKRSVQKKVRLPISEWRTLDSNLALALLNNHYVTHVHWPTVQHNHGRLEYENTIRSTGKVSTLRAR